MHAACSRFSAGMRRFTSSFRMWPGKIAAYEGVSLEGFKATYHDIDKIGAPIASGSHKFDGIVVIPCSAKTLAAVANGYADNLITRTADVCLKEKRNCILVTREMPLSRIHLKNMLAAAGSGCDDHARVPGVLSPPEDDRRYGGHGRRPGPRPPRTSNTRSRSDGAATMREFIEKMRERGLVTDVEEPVSADLQAAKMSSTTDKLLFFHKIGGARAVMNLTASRTALSIALGIDEKNMVKTLADAKFDGKVVTEGSLPMKKPDLAKLPIMHHFPKDAGKYLTSGIVFSRYDGVENASIHRMLVLDDHRLAARLVEGRHTHVMLGKALAKGRETPYRR